MVSRDERDDVNFRRLEPPQSAVPDQIVRMPMVTLVADVDADIVEQRRILQPFPLTVAETVHAPGLVEHGE